MSATAGRYAARTEVKPDKSILDIQRELGRYGAHAFAYGYEGEKAAIGFKMNNRTIRIVLTIPSPDEFSKTPAGRRRTPAQAREAWNQSLRQRWRALLLIVKAKLEAVASQIATFDDEWLAYIVLPTGETVSEMIDVDAAVEGKELPALLPGIESGGSRGS